MDILESMLEQFLAFSNKILHPTREFCGENHKIRYCESEYRINLTLRMR